MDKDLIIAFGFVTAGLTLGAYSINKLVELENYNNSIKNFSQPTSQYESLEKEVIRLDSLRNVTEKNLIERPYLKSTFDQELNDIATKKSAIITSHIYTEGLKLEKPEEKKPCGAVFGILGSLTLLGIGSTRLFVEYKTRTYCKDC